MAPEPDILKRKRSRPSDWWAAVPSPQQLIVAAEPIQHPVRKNKKKSEPVKNGKSVGNEIMATKNGKGSREVVDNTPLDIRSAGVGVEGEENSSTTSTKTKKKSTVTNKGSNSSEISTNTPLFSTNEHIEGERNSPAILKQSASRAGKGPEKIGGISAESSQDIESGSGKRKRVRPSTWWAANPVNTSIESTNSTPATTKAKPSKPRSSSARQIATGSSTIENGDHTVHTSASNTATVPREEDSRSSKRQRAPPSDWWAAPASTPDEPRTKKQRKGAFKAKSSHSVLKDVPSRGNISTIVKPTKTGDANKDKQKTLVGDFEDYLAGKIEKMRNAKQEKERQEKQQQGAPLKVLSKDQGTFIAELSGSSRQRSSASRPHGSEQIVEVETAKSNFGRGRAGTGGRVEPVQGFQGGKSSKTSRKGRKEAKSQPRVPSIYAATSQTTQKKKRSDRKTVEIVPASNRASRREASPDVPGNGDPMDEISDYQHLAPVTRRVNRHTIEEKWDGLPPNCVELISQILVNSQRPVIARISGENKRAQANTALQMISRRLLSKISKGLPFPKGVGQQREDDFDFEKIIDRNRRLEGQLTSEIDANKLLDESLNKELARLQSEKETLANLEANAKTESALRKTASAKFHPLLQSAASQDGEDLEDSSNSRASRVIPSLGITTDENLQMVVRDLEGHVDSLLGNFKPVSGLPEAMTRARAAVQIMIHDRLGSERCQDVVLGA